MTENLKSQMKVAYAVRLSTTQGETWYWGPIFDRREDAEACAGCYRSAGNLARVVIFVEDR